MVERPLRSGLSPSRRPTTWRRGRRCRRRRRRTRDVHLDLAVESNIAALGQHQDVVGAQEVRQVLAEHPRRHARQGFDPAGEVGQDHPIAAGSRNQLGAIEIGRQVTGPDPDREVGLVVGDAPPGEAARGDSV